MGLIFIVGYYGYKNTGDDIMLCSLLNIIHDTDAKYAVLNCDIRNIPIKMREQVTIIPMEIRPILAAFLKSKVIILGGGTHLFNYGDFIKSFKINARILIMALATKNSFKKLHFINVGVGSYDNSLLELMGKISCWLCDVIIVRDHVSYSLLNKWGIKKAKVTADISVVKNIPKYKTDKKLLGITFLPVYEVYYNNPAKDAEMLSNIAYAVNQARANYGISLSLVILNGGRNGDKIITYKLYEKIHDKSHVIIEDYSSSPAVLINAIAKCDYYVGMRYHGALYAYMTNTPQISIEYMPKCHYLATEIGVKSLSLEDILAGRLLAEIQKLITKPAEYIPAMNVPQYQSSINMVYSEYKELLHGVTH